MGADVNARHHDSTWRMTALSMMRPEELRKLLSSDPRKAAPWVHAAATHGLIEGQVRLGRMLLTGEGIIRDEAAALEWFARAAERGDADAQNMLGRCYECGWGVVADTAIAAHWYARAAEAGHAWAQYNLGHLLLDGNGVACNRDEAFIWYRRASEQGHERAMNLLARCYEEGWGTARDAGAARDWYRASAERGYFRGQYNYATVLVADGCIEGAVMWYEKALSNAPHPTREIMRQALSQSDHRRLRMLALPPGAGITEGLI
jgi:TPR repeat protein